MHTVLQEVTNMNNWWPVTDEEWEQLNYPQKYPKPVDKEKTTK